MTNEEVILPMTINIENLELYKNAFEVNGMPMSLEKLTWQHDNYLKPSYISWIIDVENDNRIKGLYSSFFIEFLIKGQKKVAAQSIDTLTDINYRGQGLFPKLASDVNKRLAENNTAFIYGFPNSNSAPGFFKKLNWQKIGNGLVPFLIKPLSLSFVFKKFLKINKISPIDYPPFIQHKNIRELNNFNNPQVNVLANNFLSQKKYFINRTSAYLNWRFIDKPLENYKSLGFFEQDVLKGFIVFTIKQKHGGNIGYIMELIYNPLTPTVGKSLLKYATTYLKKSNADVILAWNFKGSPNYNIFKKSLFLRIPEKLQSIKLFFGACLFDKNNITQDFYNSDNWYISYCDSDTV
jgi:Acetyltransferase (GNAT) domain